VGISAANQWAILRRDSLFFGAAVARALRDLGDNVHWSLVLQDWQAATVALALAGLKQNHDIDLFLTLHNSYDSGAIEQEDLLGVGIDPVTVPAPEVFSKKQNRRVPVSTVLGRAIPLVNKPLFTVSEQFANDFTEDIFQSRVMADHLQDLLKPPNLIGVNNGTFTSLALPEKPALADARLCKYQSLKEWKLKQKTAALAALAQFTPDEKRPAWGHIPTFVRQAEAGPEVPWFVLAGRDDTRQKGYDVAAEAIRNFLTTSGNKARAQFLFFPIPGDEGTDGLLFLRRLAEAHKANILVMPFIFQEGYLAALQGAAFGIMPSLYEPFGMANEFYLNGAVGIGRATGGLIQQIVPLRSVASFTPDVERRTRRWHTASIAATGFLYREPDDYPEIADHWKAFNEVAYLSTPGGDRVAERKEYRLFSDMACALKQAIEDAIEVYNQAPAPNGAQRYYAMLIEGIGHIQRGFSWEWSAAEYNSYLT